MADHAQHSVSWIWWRKRPLEWSLAADGKRGLITLFDENQVQLVLRDGSTTIVAVATIPDDPVTNQFLYASLAALHEEMGDGGEAIRSTSSCSTTS